jgi:glyoxylase-like metal-dependent hydrolase (beta-lactamase superfamily II)
VLEPGLTAIHTTPSFAIDQRALHIERVLWDCVALIDDPTAAQLDARGGIDVIAISHPHYYTTMVEWAERFDARILLHEADQEWIMRPSERIELWSGEEHRLTDTLTLINLGGHFPGGTVCLWSQGADGKGALLSGDILQVVLDRDWVSFMWSYPNLIPLPAKTVERIRDQIAAYEFDRVYGAFEGRTIDEAGHSKVLRSADRYIKALGVA